MGTAGDTADRAICAQAFSDGNRSIAETAHNAGARRHISRRARGATLVNLETMVRLLVHRGSLFIIKETWVKGDRKLCPRCKGSGRYEVGGTEQGGHSERPVENGRRGNRNGRVESRLGGDDRTGESHRDSERPTVPQPGWICAVCEGHGRAQKRFVVQEVPHWYFQVTDAGVEFSITLKRDDVQIFFTEEEARAWAIFRNFQEMSESMMGVQGWIKM